TVCTSMTRSMRYSAVGSCSLSPIAWAQASANPSVHSALASQQYSWCQKHQIAIGSGERSVRKMRSHGTSTSSIQSWPSSSSKRLVRGATDGVARRGGGRSGERRAAGAAPGEAPAERRQKRVRVAGGVLAAEHGDAGRADGHDEGGAMAVPVHARVGPHIDILGVDRTRVHADLAAQHEPRIGLADYA